MSQYDNYCSFLKTNDFDHFKNNDTYFAILEHVSKEIGEQYLYLIDSEFEISYENIVEFCMLNDHFGNPKKETFFSQKNKKYIVCSPTTLRYIYHALTILTYYKETSLNEMVEIGCGYGGLFFAINYFSKLLEITVNKYHLVDLPDVCKLINFYLTKNSEHIHIPFETYESTNYGKNINSDLLFLISNYCFTEIDDEYKMNYCEHLFPKIKHGFIIWQTCAYSLDYIHILKKDIKKIQTEKPQTCTDGEKLNSFVYF